MGRERQTLGDECGLEECYDERKVERASRGGVVSEETYMVLERLALEWSMGANQTTIPHPKFADESLKIKTKRPAKGRPNTERLFYLLATSSYLYIIEINQ